MSDIFVSRRCGRQKSGYVGDKKQRGSRVRPSAAFECIKFPFLGLFPFYRYEHVIITPSPDDSMKGLYSTPFSMPGCPCDSVMIELIRWLITKWIPAERYFGGSESTSFQPPYCVYFGETLQLVRFADDREADHIIISTEEPFFSVHKNYHSFQQHSIHESYN
jgi:hypothetical protein